MPTTASTVASANPTVKGGVVAYLQVNGAIKAAEFYRRAFGPRPPRFIRWTISRAHADALATVPNRLLAQPGINESQRHGWRHEFLLVRE